MVFAEESQLRFIHERCFQNSGIELFKAPAHLISIGKGAFYGCRSLRNVEFNQELESVDEYAFSKCEALQQVQLIEKPCIIPDHCFEGAGLRQAFISENIFIIGAFAFYDCR